MITTLIPCLLSPQTLLTHTTPLSCHLKGAQTNNFSEKINFFFLWLIELIEGERKRKSYEEEERKCCACARSGGNHKILKLHIALWHHKKKKKHQGIFCFHRHFFIIKKAAMEVNQQLCSYLWNSN